MLRKNNARSSGTHRHLVRARVLGGRGPGGREGGGGAHSANEGLGCKLTAID